MKIQYPWVLKRQLNQPIQQALPFISLELYRLLSNIIAETVVIITINISETEDAGL